ncbi:MAG: transglutaminase domain-containing protein [Candidatus Nanoarchaeia archaeon]
MNFMFKVGFKKYYIRMVFPEKSVYYNKYAPRSYNDLRFFSTIDDTVIQDMAHQLNYQMEGRSDNYKAKALLNFFHQNFTYISDEEQFQIEDVWELPAHMIKTTKGDCDGFALAYTALAHNMGLDVVTVVYSSHMAVAVRLNGKIGWDSIMHDDKEYFIVDPTSRKSKIGIATCDKSIIYITLPSAPSERFKLKLTHFPTY